MLRPPVVSFVIATRNRREALLSTLAHIDRCGLSREQYDVHVVDNCSTDGTVAHIRKLFPRTVLYPLKTNQGPVAKNIAIEKALGKYIVMLDDDSYPQPGAVERMIRHFEADPTLGAAGFTITLPNGQRECSAYPDVFIGCGVGLRRRILRTIGTLPADFFMQAEEYDLSLRIINAGYHVKTFSDLHVMHLKTPTARISSRTMRLDTRNNLVLILRYFPRKHILPFAWDWMRRYHWIAQTKGQTGAFLQGIFGGILRILTGVSREPISDEAFETFTRMDDIKHRLQLAKERYKLKRVLFVDLGKNIRAYHRAAELCGLKVVAIADENLASPARRYRGLRIVNEKAGRSLQFDAVVISNLSPVHAERRRNQWQSLQDRPVIDLYDPSFELTVGISDGLAGSEFHQTAVRSA